MAPTTIPFSRYRSNLHKAVNVIADTENGLDPRKLGDVNNIDPSLARLWCISEAASTLDKLRKDALELIKLDHEKLIADIDTGDKRVLQQGKQFVLSVAIRGAAGQLNKTKLKFKLMKECGLEASAADAFIKDCQGEDRRATYVTVLPVGG